MDPTPRYILPLPGERAMNTHQPVQVQRPYNGNSSIMGKVVRVRPNIYIFVCDFCESEHRTIDNFLRHSESHFQSNALPDATTSSATQIHSNQNPAGQFQPGTASNSIAPYPVQLSPIDVASSPSHASEDYIDEVYEITDLGYDFDGLMYPNAVSELSVKPAERKRGRPKIETRPNVCCFCNRNFTRTSSLKRHEHSAHAKIFEKIITQKFSYKCKICNTKFPKTSHTLQRAQEHLKTHFKT